MNKKLNVFIILFVVLLISNVSAALFVIDDYINITNKTNENIYAFGGDIQINSEVQRDIFMIAGNIESNMYINEDFTALGSKIIVNKDVNEDLRILGTNVIINKDINGDAIIISTNLLVNNKSTINQKLYALGSVIEIDGILMQGARLRATKVIINGEIYGDIKIEAKTVEFGEEGLIKGNLEVSEIELDESKIQGEITHIPKIKKQINWTNLIYNFFTLLLFGLVLLFLCGKKFEKTNELIKTKPLLSLITGLIALIITPFIILILMLSIIGLPLGLLLFAIYLFMIFFSFVIVSYRIGDFVFESFSLKNKILGFIIGIILITLLIKLPYIGGTISFLILILGSGSFVLLFKKTSIIKKKKPVKKIPRKRSKKRKSKK